MKRREVVDPLIHKPWNTLGVSGGQLDAPATLLPGGEAFRNYSRTPLIRKIIIQNSNYPDRLDPSDKFVGNSTKVTCLEITGY